MLILTKRPIYTTLYLRDKVYSIFNTPEYDEWLDTQPAKSQVQIRNRISHIQDDGHFEIVKSSKMMFVN